MDSSVLVGLAFALLSSFFMGIYVAPKKIARQDSLLFTLTMVFGFFAGSLIMFLVNVPWSGFFAKINTIYFIESVLIGPLWALGVYFLVIAVGRIGLSRANPWKNLSPLFAIVFGFFLLNEYATVKPLYVVAGGILVFLSAYILSRTDDGKIERKRTDFAGILIAVLSGFILAVVTILNKVAIPIGVIEQQLVWSASSFVSLLVLSLILRKDALKVGVRDNLIAFGAGFIYLGASYFLLSSLKYLEMSIAYPIVQSNVIWAVGVGVLFFHEIDVKKYKWRIFLGVLFGMLGILFLALAK